MSARRFTDLPPQRPLRFQSTRHGASKGPLPSSHQQRLYSYTAPAMFTPMSQNARKGDGVDGKLHRSRSRTTSAPTGSIPEIPPKSARSNVPNQQNQPRKPNEGKHKRTQKSMTGRQFDTQESLRLCEFVQRYENSLPLRIKVTKGYYGDTSKESVSNQEVYAIHCVKITEVVTIRDTSGNTLNVPLGSSIKFGFRYNPSSRTEENPSSHTFERVSDILKVDKPPKVVRATKACQPTVEKDELLVIRSPKTDASHKKGLVVFSLSTYTEKTLPPDCTGRFSTNPGHTSMHLSDITKYISAPFPCEAVMHLDNINGPEREELLRTMSSTVTLEAQRSVKSLVATTAHPGGEDESIDIDLENPILRDAEVVLESGDSGSSDPLYARTKEVIKQVQVDPTKLQPMKADQAHPSPQNFLMKLLRKGHEKDGVTISTHHIYEQIPGPHSIQHPLDPDTIDEQYNDYRDEGHFRDSIGQHTTTDKTPPPPPIPPRLPMTRSSRGLAVEHTDDLEEYVIQDPPEEKRRKQTLELPNGFEMVMERVVKKQLKEEMQNLQRVIMRSGSISSHSSYYAAFHEGANFSTYESMETLNLKDVVCELNDFSGWYQLGVFMNVPKNVLDQIHADYGHGPNAMRRCQIEMISYWLENGRDPTWSFLISALHSIGKTVLAVKIANRYGAGILPSYEPQDPLQLKGATYNREELSRIKQLQKDMHKQDYRFNKVEQQKEQLLAQLHSLQSELTDVRDRMHFNEEYTRMLLTDDHLQKEELKKLQGQGSQKQHKQMSSGKRSGIHKDEISRLEKARERVQNKLGNAQSEAVRLEEQIEEMETRYTSASEKIQDLQEEREKLKAHLQRYEKEVDKSLLAVCGEAPTATKVNKTTEYYNVMRSAGNVVRKLTQSEIDLLEKKLEHKESEIELLEEQQQYLQRKLGNINRHIHSLEKDPLYATAGDPASIAFEQHQYFHLRHKVHIESLQCKLELTEAEFSKQQLQSRLDCQKETLQTVKSSFSHESFRTSQKSQSPKMSSAMFPDVQAHTSTRYSSKREHPSSSALRDQHTPNRCPEPHFQVGDEQELHDTTNIAQSYNHTEQNITHHEQPSSTSESEIDEYESVASDDSELFYETKAPRRPPSQQEECYESINPDDAQFYEKPKPIVPPKPRNVTHPTAPQKSTTRNN